jgi:putative FmdB family regulatory protein
MPLYEFLCEKCRKPFELTMTISEHEKARPKCPKCKGTKSWRSSAASWRRRRRRAEGRWIMSRTQRWCLMITETGFTVRARGFQPAYLRLGFDEIERRAEEAVPTLASCQVCPRNCRVDRLQGRTAVCKSGRYALVGSHFPHFGPGGHLKSGHTWTGQNRP